MQAFLALVLFCLLVMFIAVPLWKPAKTETEEDRAERKRESGLADLEARKEDKYREIRDTELDLASGKLSQDAFKRQDAELRADAVKILEEIDRLQAEKDD